MLLETAVVYDVHLQSAAAGTMNSGPFLSDCYKV
jgi:hypothetical protein